MNKKTSSPTVSRRQFLSSAAFATTAAQRQRWKVVDETLHAIWMKNCKFPIDIVWLDEKRAVVHVASGVPPCKKDPCPSYQPLRRAAYVIEMNSGAAKQNKVKTGATVAFNLVR